MKFLCIPCDVKMETQTDGIMPEENTNLAMKFKCKKCGHMIAMLTNKFETEFVSKLGVEMGGGRRRRMAKTQNKRIKQKARLRARRTRALVIRNRAALKIVMPGVATQQAYGHVVNGASATQTHDMRVI